MGCLLALFSDAGPAVALLSGVMFIVMMLGRNYLSSNLCQVNTGEPKKINEDAEVMLQVNQSIVHFSRH